MALPSCEFRYDKVIKKKRRICLFYEKLRMFYSVAGFDGTMKPWLKLSGKEQSSFIKRDNAALLKKKTGNPVATVTLKEAQGILFRLHNGITNNKVSRSEEAKLNKLYCPSEVSFFPTNSGMFTVIVNYPEHGGKKMTTESALLDLAILKLKRYLTANGVNKLNDQIEFIQSKLLRLFLDPDFQCWRSHLNYQNFSKRYSKYFE